MGLSLGAGGGVFFDTPHLHETLCNHLNSPCYFFLPIMKDVMCGQMFLVEVFIGGGRGPGTNEYT